jgi:hypothetical protein
MLQRNRVQLDGNQLWIVDENGEQVSPTVDLRDAEVVALLRDLAALGDPGGLQRDWFSVEW